MVVPAYYDGFWSEVGLNTLISTEFWFSPARVLPSTALLNDLRYATAMRIFYRKCINVARRRDPAPLMFIRAIIRAITDGSLRLWFEAMRYLYLIHI